MPSNKVCTLVRGPKAAENVSDEKLRAILDDLITTDEEKMVKLWRTINTARFGDFTDQAYSVSFRVTKPIGLTALGFFGPFEKNSAVYRLKFNIYQMASMTSRMNPKILTSFDKRVEAYKDRIFYANFDDPIYCPVKTWIRIEFMMNGPVTSVCRRIYTDYTSEGVCFDFHNSSKQIPEIKYVLL
ncbi:unnamed protein product [Allacma fusca]|uniref:Uncharacterized protein n=1 Tax=Allacma fusca TaxID=39272 RepID=A0A8J2NMM3_9HEXA|nr:unnamed protein product [Allacma fusca]